MNPWPIHVAGRLGGLAAILLLSSQAASPAPDPGNRLVYLDEANPFYVGTGFPRLTTPQWLGEPGVDAVVTLGIDDLRDAPKYEAFFRPILERLKLVDGRAPLSVFCCQLHPEEPLFLQWLKEGVSLEVHTLSHPCPILAGGDFNAAAATYHDAVALLNQVPGNVPVAFRTPCCDSIDSPSPRVYAELIARTNAAGQFLRMDSSVMMLLTGADETLPRDLVVEPDGHGRFARYVPFPDFVTTVENYPYPWVIDRVCWEFACMAPSDWEAQNVEGNASPKMLADWEAALDAVVSKKGLFNFVFHPHGWSSNSQFVAFIDHAQATYGARVKFLNYREAHERLTHNLGAGQPLRAADGSDNGVRLVDLDNDGFLDVLIGNPALERTRLWDPRAGVWNDSPLPVRLVDEQGGRLEETGVRFGVLDPDGHATLILRNDHTAGAWTFDGTRWIQRPELLQGLEVGGNPVLTRHEGRDTGARLRDVDGDGVCEFLVANATMNAVFRWDAARQRWLPLEWGFPPGTSIVNDRGEDNGLRFVDINDDGHDDVLFSNEERYGVWLYQPQPYLGWGRGWTRQTVSGVRSAVVGRDAAATNTPLIEIPAIVRAGPHRNNGAWVHGRTLWFQNEDTASLSNHVDRRNLDDLVRGDIPGPLEPREALASFRVRDGFEIECVAAEPLVQDPVSFDWAADGRLWVAEMRDYPMGMDGHGQAGGEIRCLRDLDGDGRFDEATTFLSGVSFPSGVMSWRHGVLVSAAPEVFYAEDTDGDGHADRREILLAGFREGNQQHRVNGFTLGLDGWVYGANGDSGGTIVSRRTGQSISLRGSDFRFRPDTGELEAVEGQTQFGRVRDDWGDWFGNANYAWLWRYPWPVHYLARNPHAPVRDLRWQLARRPGGNHLYPASRALPRPNAVGEENTVTSACSPAPYRDELFGAEFASSVFMGEPSENVVHREVLVTDASGPNSRRAPGEEQSEFLASSDPWFRPVFVRTGPDGALYIADMYRQVIEHPEWIPMDLQRRLDLRAGEDRGRIYRVAPVGSMRRGFRPLDRLDTSGLVAALDSPNGWQRDTVMRRLGEDNDPRAAEPLRALLRSSDRAVVRLQALATLGLLGRADAATVLKSLQDPNPAVRTEAVRLAEGIVGPAGRDAREEGPAALKEALLGLDPGADSRLAVQLAFTLGEIPDPRAGARLVHLIQDHAADPILRPAVLSSALPHLAPMLKAMATTERSPDGPLLGELLRLAVVLRAPGPLEEGLKALRRLDNPSDAEAQFDAASGLVRAAAGQKSAPAVDWDLLNPVVTKAARVAEDAQAPEGLRLAALRVLSPSLPLAGLSLDRWVRLLDARQSPAIQGAALKALGRRQDPTIADALLAGWEQFGPSTRGGIVDLLLTRETWTDALVAALERGRPSPREMGVVSRQRLLEHGSHAVRERASKLFTAAARNRQSVVESMAAARTLSGDVSRGWETFQVHCSGCHRLAGVGHDVGPDLGTVLDKSRDALLVAILDPNRAVEERYLAYTAVLADGREFSGILVSESPDSVTLRTAAGAEEVFPRKSLASLQGAGRSLMPEGFETVMDAASLADLMALLRAGGPP